LEILERNEVKATFFVTAQENHLEEYRKIVDAGHAIGIHSYTHNYSKVYASKKAFIKDVTDMSDLIYRETGVRTRLYRFPGGSANSVSSTPVETLISWLNEEDYIYFDWNALTGDAVTKNLSASTLIDNVMANIKQNTKNKIDSTVLMHDLTTKHNTVEALEPLIQTLKEQGYVMDKALDESVKPVQQKVIE
jgi:peptidoglycan/xylan/chitin deacetylase (PgdA/CDA1 family)